MDPVPIASRPQGLTAEVNAAVYLRGYQPSDTTAMHALDTFCFEPPFRFSRSTMRRYAQAPGAIVRLACEDGGEEEGESLLAFCIVHIEGAEDLRIAYVVTLDVHPEYRQRGLGQVLMRSAEADAAGVGARGIALHVFKGNAPAIRLYERLGYGLVRPVKDFYGKGLDALVYRKLLTPRPKQV